MPLSTIDPSNVSNICDTCSLRGPTDTRSIIYERRLIDELVEEQKYCHKDLTNTRAVEITTNFIAFFTAQNINSTAKDNYRITIAFDFTDPHNLPVNLEETYGFNQRGIIKPVDNGQLCPTYCP